MARPDLWDDPKHGAQVGAEYGRINDDVKLLDGITGALEDAQTLYELAVEEGDDSVGRRTGGHRRRHWPSELDELDLRSLFIGEFDERDAVLRGARGRRRHRRAGLDRDDAAHVPALGRATRLRGRGRRDDARPGGRAAVGDVHRQGSLRLRPAVQAERGVHRLYRISPFDSQARRQTSYAALDVTPFVEDVSDEVKIDEKDLRVDYYRSSGAGGQHVNVTDSAVRITHLPTMIVVTCQNERSQIQNRARAMQVLAAKLAERQREERRAELAAITGPQGQVSRAGNFIRGYVLAPYQLVKDERTEHETGNVAAVLDGDLDEFMESWLRWRRGQAERA